MTFLQQVLTVWIFPIADRISNGRITSENAISGLGPRYSWVPALNVQETGEWNLRLYFSINCGKRSVIPPSRNTQRERANGTLPSPSKVGRGENHREHCTWSSNSCFENPNAYELEGLFGARVTRENNERSQLISQDRGFASRGAMIGSSQL